MFTGIIETMAEIRQLTREGSNVHIDLASPIQTELKIDQSVSHNGVCLTVVDVKVDFYRVTAVQETLQKTNLADWKIGEKVNIERCMPANGRFDGHIVQGHVDQVGTVVRIMEKDGSWEFDFSYDPSVGNVTVEKGSICVNGTSLTCFNSRKGGFTVAIIPYTFENTIFHQLVEGDRVNLEFDVVGKYIQRILRGYDS
ncbi:Riboflavin synthase eubacterial/eukaryotic [Lunatimonas lonarensis]|uniref:Riboflavin synthase n=1 Tax=Lunatimonas lonarensis TaxID=1232681 RepID=R7ZPJ8_9BACT|nr:riboflavin synthase [Lunatimonas lonarensis]EON75949.1 Riboflavin synthase eubacterial/eukaryotic [Lunatimonas lonarensis]